MKILNPIDRVVDAMIGKNLEDAGRAWARVGVVVLCVAAWMSYDFGSSVSLKHAIFLACLTFVAAFGPDAAHKAWNTGKKGAAVAIAIVCAPLLAIEFYSHAGYTAGLRGHNIAEARVANVKYDGAQEATKEDKTNLEMWKSQLSTLMEKDAWTATVKADALRESLATIKARIDEEKKGNRGRKAGCGKECERLQNEANAIAEKIGKVEQREDLGKRIEATQRILDSKREVAAKTEHKSSAVVHQNMFLAKAVALVGYQSLEPSAAIEESAQQSANLAMAVAGTGLPAFALFIAGLYRRKDDEEIIRPSHTDVQARTPTYTAPRVAQPQYAPPVVTRSDTISVVKASLEDLMRSKAHA